ncbi:chlorophyllase-2-like [Malania oleifera]|uniref:chlorophyllase-2-like n=1 Tax=Malania oleifera TaxID=397392 RepID=UPI0025AE80B8|nr:chlorophyllase-2-like [Malania oleifera]
MSTNLKSQAPPSPHGSASSSLIIMLPSASSSSLNATAAASTDVFDIGKHSTVLLNVEPAEETTYFFFKKSSSSSSSGNDSNDHRPPKPLLIAAPSDNGEFPVLQFLHGYLFHNSFYSQLLQHVASHGFIVVAPQLYYMAGADATDEINSAAEITNWLPQGLQDFLPAHVLANLKKLGLAGHSRGGKVAFALALNKVATATTTLKFSALIGIDPVDGRDKGNQTQPPVLTYIPRSFDLDMAVLVIGSGLGEVKRCLLMPACAPKGVNHEDFFEECKDPAGYFVVKDYGHVDMMDDDTEGFIGKASKCMCKNGMSREPMRRFVGGAVVAFMKAYMHGDFGDLVAIIEGKAMLPVELQKVDFHV